MSNSFLIVQLSVVTRVRSGTKTNFWTDKWLNGNSISILAPEVLCKVDRKNVAEALQDRSWVRDIRSPPYWYSAIPIAMGYFRGGVLD
jgi:hypothetical protein